MKRRGFLKSLLAGAAVPKILSPQSVPDWGGPVLDTHLHLRRDPDSCYTHLQGCGVSNAILLTIATREKEAIGEMERRPGTFARSVSADPALPDSSEIFRGALKAGAVSIGELKFHLALDSPEMKRVYDLAAEWKVPVMMHIQVFPHYPGELPYNTGYPQFERVLKSHPRTTFIGHGDLFWAHISANVPTDRGYPTGPIEKGGLTDKWLSDFPNIYADLSANSGNNALSRDPDFTREFLVRQKTKLIFGSDCSCADGNGSGVSQNNNPEAARLTGKCVARETLGLLKRLSSPEIFRKAVWENGTKVFMVKLS